MFDKIVFCLSEAFRKEGMIVPFGTTYRVSEDLLAMLNEDAKDLIICGKCKNHEPCKIPNRVWCMKMCRYMKEDGYCSEGGEKK